MYLLLDSAHNGITAKGQLRTQPGHLIDIMATCLAITGVNYPSHYNGNEIQPYEGVSLLPAFTNKNLKREWLFWEHEGNRALRVGNWKIVSRVQKNKGFTRTDETAWELYDLEKDPTEQHNLAAETKYSKLVEEMKKSLLKERIKYQDTDKAGVL